MINIEINIKYRSAVYGLGIRPEPGLISPSPFDIFGWSMKILWLFENVSIRHSKI